MYHQAILVKIRLVQAHQVLLATLGQDFNFGHEILQPLLVAQFDGFGRRYLLRVQLVSGFANFAKRTVAQVADKVPHQARVAVLNQVLGKGAFPATDAKSVFHRRTSEHAAKLVEQDRHFVGRYCNCVVFN